MKITFLITNQHKYEWAMNLIQSIESLGHTLKVYRANKTHPWQLKDQDLVISYGYFDIVPEEVSQMIIELGFIDRFNKEKNPQGYLQVCPDKIANIVKDKVNSDRVLVKVKPLPLNKEAPVLILGQKELDKQHGLNHKELKEYYQGIIKQVREENPNRSIWFRNHPASSIPHNFSGVKNMDTGTVEDLVGMVSKVYTYSSTGGLPFLQHLIPVIAHESCYYHEVGVNPTQESVEDLLARIGYSQWSSKELKNKYIVETLLEYCKTGIAPKQWLPAPELPSISPQNPSIDPQIESNTPLPPKQFEIDTACVILDEPNFYVKKKLFRNTWPGVKCDSKADIVTHCESIIALSKEI